MEIKKEYFENEIENWEYLAEFFKLNIEEETENDFEKTKELFNQKIKEVYKNKNIIVYIISNKDKILVILEDLEEEISYFINL